MDVKSYCDSIGIALNGWKAKLYDVIRKAESLTDSEKDKFAPMVQELNSMVDDLEARLKALETECPSEWSSDEAAIDRTITRIGDKWKDVWGVMGEHEYGIGEA